MSIVAWPSQVRRLLPDASCILILGSAAVAQQVRVPVLPEPLVVEARAARRWSLPDEVQVRGGEALLRHGLSMQARAWFVERIASGQGCVADALGLIRACTDHDDAETALRLLRAAQPVLAADQIARALMWCSQSILAVEGRGLLALSRLSSIETFGDLGKPVRAAEACELIHESLRTCVTAEGLRARCATFCFDNEWEHAVHDAEHALRLEPSPWAYYWLVEALTENSNGHKPDAIAERIVHAVEQLVAINRGEVPLGVIEDLPSLLQGDAKARVEALIAEAAKAEAARAAEWASRPERVHAARMRDWVPLPVAGGAQVPFADRIAEIDPLNQRGMDLELLAQVLVDYRERGEDGSPEAFELAWRLWLAAPFLPMSRFPPYLLTSVPSPDGYVKEPSIDVDPDRSPRSVAGYVAEAFVRCAIADHWRQQGEPSNSRLLRDGIDSEDCFVRSIATDLLVTRAPEQFRALLDDHRNLMHLRQKVALLARMK